MKMHSKIKKKGLVFNPEERQKSIFRNHEQNFVLLSNVTYSTFSKLPSKIHPIPNIFSWGKHVKQPVLFTKWSGIHLWETTKRCLSALNWPLNSGLFFFCSSLLEIPPKDESNGCCAKQTTLPEALTIASLQLNLVPLPVKPTFNTRNHV